MSLLDSLVKPTVLYGSIQSTIGVKQGCPLSPTLFGIYIDELEAFLYDCSLLGDGYLHQVFHSPIC